MARRFFQRGAAVLALIGVAQLFMAWHMPDWSDSSTAANITAPSEDEQSASLLVGFHTSRRSETTIAPSLEKEEQSASQRRAALWVDLANDTDFCSALMGNGFKEEVAYCVSRSNKSGDSSLSCKFNSVTGASVCRASNLLVDLDRVNCSHGNEEISDVEGRDEAEEMPLYSKGAFRLKCESTGQVPDALKLPDHFSPMFSAIEYAREEDDISDFIGCQMWIEIPCFIVTRYEYCNLYHTMTDWYNIYQVRHMLGLGEEVVSVIFFDGHSKGALDVGWQHVMGQGVAVSFLMALPARHTCFRHAIFVPPGYRSAIAWTSMRYPHGQCRDTAQMRDFANHFLASFGLLEEAGRAAPLQRAPNDTVRVTFVMRKNYMAHPRKSTSADRQISNEEEAVSAVASVEGTRVQAVSFEHISTLQEQMAIIAHTDLLIGVHGAGLTFSLFLPPEAAVLELVPPGGAKNVHFNYTTAWAGLYYRTFPIGHASPKHHVDPSRLREVVEQVLQERRRHWGSQVG